MPEVVLSDLCKIHLKVVLHVLQMLEASRNTSRFADRIEYAIFAQA